MPNHFSDIGFSVSSEEDFRELAMFVANSGEQNSNSQIVWKDPSGAQLWVQITEGSITEFVPYFEGLHLSDVVVDEVFPNNGFGLENLLKVWVEGQISVEEKIDPDAPGFYPYILESPVPLREFPELPFRAKARIAAFAHHLAVTEPEDEKEVVDPSKEIRFADKHFIPSGMFNFEEEDADAEPSAYAYFGGEVLSVEKRENQLTKKAFFVIQVSSLEAEYTIVADPALLEELPLVGQIISGEFWMTGRLVDKNDE